MNNEITLNNLIKIFFNKKKLIFFLIFSFIILGIFQNYKQNYNSDNFLILLIKLNFPNNLPKKIHHLNDKKIYKILSDKFNVDTLNLNKHISIKENFKFGSFLRNQYFELFSKLKKLESSNRIDHMIIEIKVNYSKLQISKQKAIKLANQIPIIWENVNHSNIENIKHKIRELPTHSFIIKNFFSRFRFYEQYYQDLKIYRSYISSEKIYLSKRIRDINVKNYLMEELEIISIRLGIIRNLFINKILCIKKKCYYELIYENPHKISRLENMKKMLDINLINRKKNLDINSYTKVWEDILCENSLKNCNINFYSSNYENKIIDESNKLLKNKQIKFSPPTSNNLIVNRSYDKNLKTTNRLNDSFLKNFQKRNLININNFEFINISSKLKQLKKLSSQYVGIVTTNEHYKKVDNLLLHTMVEQTIDDINSRIFNIKKALSVTSINLTNDLYFETLNQKSINNKLSILFLFKNLILFSFAGLFVSLIILHIFSFIKRY